MHSPDKEPVVGLSAPESSEKVQPSAEGVDPTELLEKAVQKDVLEVLGIRLDPTVLDKEDYPSLNVA